MEKYATSESKTGQAAEEVAGQADVANHALIKALSAAGAKMPGDQGRKSFMPHASDKPAGGWHASFAIRREHGQSIYSRDGSCHRRQDRRRKGHAGANADADQQPPGGPTTTAKANGGAPATARSGQKLTSWQAQLSRSGVLQSGKPSGATDKSAQSTSGQQSPEGQMANSSADSKLGERTFHEEPWVAKLPPELRQAIRAQSQRPPPRGYEGRLRRYFENVD